MIQPTLSPFYRTVPRTALPLASLAEAGDQRLVPDRELLGPQVLRMMRSALELGVRHG